MNENKAGEKYGKSFALRMVLLLGLLALVAAGLYYDRQVLPKRTATKINDAFALMTKPDDGQGISKQMVEETIGFSPTESEADGYEIQLYEFKRALPFAKGDYLNVIFEHGDLVSILHNTDYELEKVKPSVHIKTPGEDYKGNRPALGGIPQPSDDDEEDDDDEDEEDDDEDEDDEDEDDEDEDDEDEEGDDDASDDDDGN